MDCVDGKAVKVTKKVLPCTLDDCTKNLMELIFSTDMFKEAMECMNLGESFPASELLCPVKLTQVTEYLFGSMPIGLGRTAYNKEKKNLE